MSNNHTLRLGRAKTWLEAFWGKKIMIFRILLVLGLSKFICGNVYAKEPFNIKGIQIGDTIDTLKKVFPEIKIKSQKNIAHCKNENFVIQNGSTFIAVREEERRKYSFQLIFVNGVLRGLRSGGALSLSLAPSFNHLLELPTKLDIDPPFRLRFFASPTQLDILRKNRLLFLDRQLPFIF